MDVNGAYFSNVYLSFMFSLLIIHYERCNFASDIFCIFDSFLFIRCLIILSKSTFSHSMGREDNRIYFVQCVVLQINYFCF